MEANFLNRMLEGVRENAEQIRRGRERIAGDGGGFNFLGGGFIPNIANIVAQQQGPVLGPDDFGSYVIPALDPTYRSGFDYARSIAGGMPMSQVIAPGVSYSPEQPMGYTQEQLNTAVGTTPVEPPQKLPKPDDPRYLGTGIGGVTIFDDVFDKKRMPPLRDIFGGQRDTSSLKNLMNIGKLFSGGIDQEAINKIVQERIAESMPIENIPSSIPEVPTGREFSVDRQPIPLQDLGYGPGIMPPLPPIDIEDIIRKPGVTTIEEAMEIPKRNNQLFIDDRPIIDERILIPPTLPPVDIPPVNVDEVIPPKINDQIFIDDRPIIDERIGMPPPPLPPVDIPPVDIPPVDIPPVDIPFIPFIKPPSIMDRPLIMDTPTIMDRPTGGRFSIEQRRPMGLF